MEIATLIERLSDPSAYPAEVDEVVVRQTHMSVVFLAGDRAYKVKKPVEFDFVDYHTLERRKHFCEREIELNRRLAPDVYLGVVPIVDEDGEVRIDGEGEPVEWAVEMVRLPDEATLASRLDRGEVDREQIEKLAARIADFHRDADSGPEVAECAKFDRVAENARDNFEHSRDQVGTTVHSGVFDRAERLNDRALGRLEDLIEARAEPEVARDTHGDLRLDHVYLFPDRSPPDEIEIVDCIEFNEKFRYADPVADVAFLVMDLEQAGRRDFADQCADAYFEASGDADGRRLLDLYVAYRAAVRGKVEGLKATEEEVPAEERAEARQTAAAHWLLALGRLEAPERRPGLVLISGLPGTGKSTLAGRIADRANLRVIDTDLVRKRLAGLEPDTEAGGAFEEGIYTSGWSDRTYGACRVRAEQYLYVGDRVAVDATFYDDDRRRRFVELARRWGVPVVILECTSPREVTRERLEARRGGPSDADWAVYEEIEEKWEPYTAETGRHREEISTDGTVEESLDRAIEALRSRGLY